MIVCLDLETTWLDKKSDEIIEVALVKFDEHTFKVIDTFSTFVNPGIKIPDVISNITNIFDEDLVWAPDLSEIKNEILDFIWDSPLLWHNVYFDRDFFIEKGINVSDNIVLDTFFLSNILLFRLASLNLEMLSKHYDKWFEWAHRALNDVKATIQLFKNLVWDFKKLSKTKKELLFYIFDISEDKNVIFLKEYLFWVDSFSIAKDDFEKKLLKNVGRFKKTDDIFFDQNFKLEKISSYFKLLWWLEERVNQVDMSDMVLDTLFKWNKTLIEAPTWLWKTFAYLIPSIIYSIKTGEKVYISTKTKTLQDQLYFKDLEFLKDNLFPDFNYTKLKWKRNYVSVHSYFDELINDELSYNKVCFLSKIILWLFETDHWELDELNYYGQEYSFLRHISSDDHITLSDTNKYKEYEFLYKAREELKQSNIVVINHSLLFSDLKTETSFLKWMDNLVIDEAHNIEDWVTDSLRKRVSLKSLEDSFNFIESIFHKKEIKKLDLINTKDKLISNVSFIMDLFYSYINTNINSDQFFKTLLIREDFYEDNDFADILKKVDTNFSSIIDILSSIEEYDFIKEVSLLKDYLDTLNIILDKRLSDKYIQMASFNDKAWVILEYTLLNPGEYLNKNLWNKLSSVVLTSATLQIWDSFDYFSKLLFLDDFDKKSFETEFDYKKQATLFIPNDLWSIKNNSAEIINFLYKFYSIVKWNTLTLLTSFNIIKKIYTSLNIDLKKQDITLLAQSMWWSKSKIQNTFIENSDTSILLGTDSFWEWVDFPWDKLKYLIIHKFPFQVPTDPIFMARSVFFNNSFADYSIPKSIIKLKQWFWRLIRSKDDKWIVILFDDRIYSSDWWKTFFNAFPKDINIKQAPAQSFLDILKK